MIGLIHTNSASKHIASLPIHLWHFFFWCCFMPQELWADKKTPFASQRRWKWHSTFEGFLLLYPNTCDTAQTIYFDFRAPLAIG
jgi:hypothetical protein